jgi:hypothetical protein
LFSLLFSISGILPNRNANGAEGHPSNKTEAGADYQNPLTEAPHGAGQLKVSVFRSGAEDEQLFRDRLQSETSFSITKMAYFTASNAPSHTPCWVDRISTRSFY